MSNSTLTALPQNPSFCVGKRLCGDSSQHSVPAGYFDAPAARQACLGGQLMSAPFQLPLPLVTLVFCAIEGLADVKVDTLAHGLNVNAVSSRNNAILQG